LPSELRTENVALCQLTPATPPSDNIGKNTGDKATVEKVKHELGYVEKAWEGGDETARWGREDDVVKP
jgi:nicotinate phosphoribosyltransferase